MASIPSSNPSSSIPTSLLKTKFSTPINDNTFQLDPNNSAGCLSVIAIRSLKLNGRQDVITKYMTQLDKVGDIVLDLKAQGKRVQLMARNIKEIEVKMKSMNNGGQEYETTKKELAWTKKEWKRLDDNWTSEAEEVADRLIGFMEKSSKIEAMARYLEEKAHCSMEVEKQESVMQHLMVVCRKVTQFLWRAVIFAGRFR